MQRKSHLIRSLVVALLFAGVWAPVAHAATIQDLPLPYLSELSSDQKSVFYKVANQALCPCNCPLTLAGCLKNRPKCRRAQMLGRYSARQSQSGQTTMDILTELAEGFPSSGESFKFSKGPAHTQKGKAGAKIQVVEFADFRCHHCKEAVRFINESLQAMGDKVEFSFRHFPLQDQEPSVLAAEAAEAAGAQGKFWPYYEMLFANQDALGRPELVKFAKQLGLDVQRFQKELDEHQYRAKVLADKAEGLKAGVNATPGIFINGRPFNLERTVANFRDRAEFESASEAECSN